jgi:hypothetical protein
VERTHKAAMFILLSLLTSLISGTVLYFVYSGRNETAVPLLIACVLVAFVLVLAAARTTSSFRKSERLAKAHNVPPSKTLHLMDLRQWLTLIVGIAVVAVTTGAFTGLRVLTSDSPPARASLPAAPAAAGTPAAIESTTPAPSASPTDSPSPTETVDPTDAVEPTDTPAGTPATQYLDTEDALDGGYDPAAVTFSAVRYPRGITFWCSSVTNSRLQWNVAGYSSFTTTAGVDDATEDAFGAVVEFIFYDQDGHQLTPKPIDVSVGHSRKVTLGLKGVVNLRMTCSSRDSKTSDVRSTHSALGDPIITQ